MILNIYIAPANYFDRYDRLECILQGEGGYLFGIKFQVTSKTNAV